MYERLIANLQVLFGLLKQTKFTLSFGFRTTNRAPRSATSDLMRVLKRFEQAGIPVRSTRLYNNWGGYITQADVKDLGIDIRGAEDMYKGGACVRSVHDRPGDGHGDRQRLRVPRRRHDAAHRRPQRNAATGNSLVAQCELYGLDRGAAAREFRPICQSCDYYKSIYHMRSTYRKEGVELQSLAEFKRRLDGTPAPP